MLGLGALRTAAGRRAALLCLLAGVMVGTGCEPAAPPPGPPPPVAGPPAPPPVPDPTPPPPAQPSAAPLGRLRLTLVLRDERLARGLVVRVSRGTTAPGRVGRVGPDGAASFQLEEGEWSVQVLGPHPLLFSAEGVSERPVRTLPLRCVSGAAPAPNRIDPAGGPRELRLRVQQQVLLGRVLDDLSGEPVASAELSGRAEARARCDWEGWFALGLEDDERVATLSAPDYLPCVVGWDSPAAGPLEVRLVRGAVAEGRVEDEAGRPVAGATINHSLLQQVQVQAGRSFQPVGRQARTDPEGRYRLLLAATAGPLHGQGLALVAAEGHVTRLVELWGGPGAPSDPVRLPHLVSLTGVVRDPEGRPVPGAQVAVVERSVPGLPRFLLPADGDQALDLVFAPPPDPRVTAPRAETDAEGRFSLQVGAGPVALAVRAPGAAELRHATDAPGEVTLTLRPAAPWRVRWKGTGEQAPAEAVVEAFPAGTLASWRTAGRAVTVGELLPPEPWALDGAAGVGVAALDHLPPGSYDLTLTRMGILVGARERVDAGQEVELTEGARCAVRISLPDGVAPDVVQVEARGEDGAPLLWSADQPGVRRYLARVGMEPREGTVLGLVHTDPPFRVVVRASGMRPRLLQVAACPGGRVELSLNALEPGGDLEVSCRAPSRPVAEVLLRWPEPAGQRRVRLSGEALSGPVLLVGLDPGRHRLEATVTRVDGTRVELDPLEVDLEVGQRARAVLQLP